MIYLDNAATTKLAPEVFEVMVPYMKDLYGNPGAVIYKHGQVAHSAVEYARCQVASLMRVHPDQVVFTSGGTEANALVLLGLSEHLKALKRTHIIVSAVEHESVLSAAERLKAGGFTVTKLPVQADGTVSVTDLKEAITAETGLVSIMYVNNELGSVNPVDQIGKLCSEHGVLFHTDCVQAAGTEPISAEKIGCDFITISSHKLHGPKGAGAVYAKQKKLLRPIIPGGHAQEYGLRGGTQNVPAIVGFGEACELTEKSFRQDTHYISYIKQRFYESLLEFLKPENKDALVVNGRPVIDPGKILNLTVKGVDAESLIMMLDTKGVYVSMGAACTGSSSEPSHVLTAIGLSPETARNTLRFSFSKYVTEEQAKEAGALTAMMVNILLANAKIWGSELDG